MRIKFKNVNVLDKDFNVIRSQDLIVEKNVISKIKPTDDTDNEKYDRVIEGNNNYIIPGFKNAHTHNAMVFLRSLSDDLKLQDWLTKYCFPNEAKLTYEDVYYFTILGIMENLSSGVTGSMDMYLDNYAMADASLKTGFRVNISDTIQKFNKKIAPEEYIETLNNYKGDNGNLVRYTLGVHAEYTNTSELLERISNLTHKYKVPFFTHNSETKEEVDECKKRWDGLTPTKVFEKFGLFDYGGGGYHSIYLDDEDIEIYKKHDIVVVTCPCSNLKLASGIAPIKKYVDSGIRVAIGTDGPASNNAIDMFREIYLTSTLQKVVCKDPVAISAKDILKMAMINGASCIGHPQASVIAEGQIADLVLINMHLPNMQPENNFVNNLVYAGSKQNVKLTMVDGKILYEDEKYMIGEDENYIYKKCNELLHNLLNRS